MRRLLAALFAVALLTGGLHPPLASAQLPQTVAERTDYKSTSRHDDVVQFCDALAKQSELVKVTAFGQSHEGRSLPLLVVADPPVASVEEVNRSEKLVVLAFANIHAGEVDGKEALLALARDLTAKPGHPLLKDLVVLLVPILNADGNDRIDPKNRTEQNGPVTGVGTRENAQGLDLNRDFMKLESPEVRALVKLVNKWDPSLIVDCHTTNGSKHRYTLTYDGPRYPTTDSPLARWADAELFPFVEKRVKQDGGYDIARYGNFSADRTKWETYPALPRYGLQYLALRGRLGVLSESYSYAPFKDRVLASRAFVTACFECAAAKKADLGKLVAMASEARVALRTKTVAFPDKRAILGFEEEVKDGKRVTTDRPKQYTLDYVTKVVAVLEVEKPFAYLVPPGYPAAVEAIRRHGIKVEELREDIELEVEAYQIVAVEKAARPFQKHQTATADAKRRTVRTLLLAGTTIVKTAQPLGTLAAYLLEPMAEDGLLTWNFFDKDLLPGKDFPVLRLPKQPLPLTVGTPRPLAEDRVINKPITEAALGGGPRGLGFGFAGNAVGGPLTGGLPWLADGEHFLQPKESRLWKVHARTGRAEPFVDPERFKKSLAEVKDIGPAAADKLARATTFRTDPARTGALVDVGSDLAFAYFDGRPAVRLKVGKDRELLTFAPNGKGVAFVRDGNLFAVDFAEPGERKLTTDGGTNDILNGRADWVYFEEIYLRNGRAFWWSPDGSHLAFLRFDDAPVKKFNIVDLRPVGGLLEEQRYPKAGAPNPLVKLGVVPLVGGKPVFLDLGDYPPEATLIVRVGWMPDSKRVYAYVQNRTQTWLDFVVWDAPDAKPRKLFRDSTKAWIDDPGEPRFLPDGSFLFASERSGWKHLYHYSAEGKEPRAVTTGQWEVRDVLRVDAEPGHVYFTGTKDGALRTHLYRAKLDGSGVERMTPEGGSHTVSLAPKGPLFLDRSTDNATPTQVFVCEAGKDRVRTVDTNPVYEREEYKFGKFEPVSVPMPDGFTLDGTLIYPPDFDPKKKYPIWVFTYAGPHMPSVHEAWGGGHIKEQSLAASGIIVFNVDPRSASGKGVVSAWSCYKQLGVQELKDLEAAVRWLGKNPWADLSRVGISGHSYGGFMAAFALTHGTVFTAGIASGPVTDWQLYDSIYTERYMLTPKENPAGYAATSCVKAARDLHGKLLVVHGMMDDNVHMQNSIQFADALQAAGKEFELMLYPRSRHGIAGQHYMKLQMDFIRRSMGVEKK